MIKKIVTCLLSVLAFAVYGQELKQSKYFALTKYAHDFGITKQEDGDLTYVFKLRNTSQKTVLITSVVPECSCTEPTWTQNEITTGGSGEINVGYKASHYPGDFEKKITVFTTADTFELKISGKVTPKPLTDIEQEYPIQIGALRFQDQVIGLNTIYDNTPKTIEVMFYNDSTKAIRNLKFDNLPAYLRMKLPDTISPKSPNKMMVSFDPKIFNDYGHTIDYIPLTVSGKKLEFSVTGNVTPYIPNYTAAELAKAPRMLIDSANTIDLGAIKRDTVYSAKINIQNTGKTDLAILKIKPACDCIKSDVTQKVIIKPGESKTVTINFDTKDRSGKTKKNIYIYSNDPANPAFIFKLIADVKGDASN
jgi:hypothetical protein